MPPTEQPRDEFAPDADAPTADAQADHIDREPEPGEDPEQRTREETQLRLLLEAYAGEVGRGPANWREVGTHYLYREHHMIVRDEYLSEVREIVADTQVEAPLVRGTTLISFPDRTIDALERVRGSERRLVEPGRPDVPQLGPGIAAPDYLITITQTPGGTGGGCPPTEPLIPPRKRRDLPSPDPAPATDRAAGQGVRLVIIDTGFDSEAAQAHEWLEGVYGDPDPAIDTDVPRRLHPYAGHGTFIAGVARCMAPAAEVIVRNVFDKVGATFESNLVRALDRTLQEDFPDLISMSAGTWTFDPTGPLGLAVFNETRLRHHKGVVLVAAAGNDNSRRPFWPAATPWTISVGALGNDGRSRAYFSSFGHWVDVFAPGEDLVNAFPTGRYTYHEPTPAHHPPRQPGDTADSTGMAQWSGTSFSTPLVAGLIAARMSRTGENGRDAGAALLAKARSAAIFGLGPVLLPD